MSTNQQLPSQQTDNIMRQQSTQKYVNSQIYSIMQMIDMEQMSEQYMSFCPIQQIIQKLKKLLIKHKLLLDLFESINQIYHKQQQNDQNYVRQSLKHTHKIILDKLLYAQIYSTDMRNLQTLIISFALKINNIFSFLQIKLSLTHQEKQQTIDFIFEKLTQQSQIQNSEEYLNSHKGQPYFPINNKNYPLYMSMAQYFLYEKCGDLELYNFIKELTLKWICGESPILLKRHLNLLYENGQETNQNQEIKNDQEIKNETQTQKQKQQQPNNSLPATQSSLQNSGQNQSQISPSKTKSRAGMHKSTHQYSSAQKQQQQQQLLPEIIHEINIKIKMNLLTQFNLLDSSEIQRLKSLCCLNFLYQFSTIRSNRFNTHQRLDDLVIIQYPQQFKALQHPIQEAVSALLNNKGGYILIGLEKHENFYLPNCTLKFSEKIANDAKKQIIDWAMSSMSFLKKLSPESVSKNIKVDFIPIFKTRRWSNGAAKQIPNHAKQGEFIWKISVFPDKVSKLIIHPIADKFYDLNRKEQSSYQINDQKSQKSQKSQKDLIYKKLKYKTENYGIFLYQHSENYGLVIQIQSMIQKHNSSKMIRHLHPCPAPHVGAFLTDKKFAEEMNKQVQISEGSSKTKNRTTGEQMGIDLKKNQSSNNEDQVQFKHINLIVLENKKIKDDCEKFLEGKKVQFKIQKLQKNNIKKLAKTTYIIHHHKKYQEMNNYLIDFKKQFNSNKKIILISAEKSVYAETLFKSEDLQRVMKMFEEEFPQIAQREKISYVQDLKEKKSFLKGDTKLGGIYLYFILSELEFKADVKIKMKNVPQLLQNSMILLRRAMNEKKQRQQEKQRKNNYNSNSNYNYNNNNAYSNHTSYNDHDNYQNNYQNNYSNQINYNSNQINYNHNNGNSSSSQYQNSQQFQLQINYDKDYWKQQFANFYQELLQLKKVYPTQYQYDLKQYFVNYLYGHGKAEMHPIFIELQSTEGSYFFTKNI